MRQAIQNQPMAESKFATALFVCIVLDNLGMFTKMASQIGTFGDAVFNTVAGKCTDTCWRVRKATKYIIDTRSSTRISHLILFPTR